MKNWFKKLINWVAFYSEIYERTCSDKENYRQWSETLERRLREQQAETNNIRNTCKELRKTNGYLKGRITRLQKKYEPEKLGSDEE